MNQAHRNFFRNIVLSLRLYYHGWTWAEMRTHLDDEVHVEELDGPAKVCPVCERPR